MLGFPFGIVASLALSALASPTVQIRSADKSTSLANLALQKVLDDASPIFGYYVKNKTSTSTWMKKYPDSTKIVHMNLPGVHDTQTWNYSLATQQALDHVTALDGVTVSLHRLHPGMEQCLSYNIQRKLTIVSWIGLSSWGVSVPTSAYH